MLKITEMENSPELDGKYLGKITKDFAVVAETLKEAAYQLKARGISDYPIFPVSQVEIPIGQILIQKEDVALDWNYYFSFLEEFVQRELITEEGIDKFRESYKDIEEFCCLFVIDRDFTNFIYIPYPEN